MSISGMVRCSILLLSAAIGFSAHAEEILTVRSAQDFEKTMTSLQQSIEAHGYTVAHVQRCDSGLTGLGYVTDRYRIVFFGKFGEVRELSIRHPDLIPFLPLKIAVFAEGDQSIVTSINPESLGEFHADADLKVQFKRWENDLRSILAEQQASSTQ